METTKLLETYFDFIYAEAIMNEMIGVFRNNCTGCQRGNLSQTNHACLMLSEQQQLELYFEDILTKVNEMDILRQWDSAVSVLHDISSELVTMYRLKIGCRDWRETDMKTLEWRSKIYRLTCQLIRLKNDYVRCV